MLPAVSAELPAYLMPPTTGEESQGKTPEPTPAAKVDIRSAGAASAPTGAPGTGLYGPDGQYVETAGQRTDKQEVSSERAPSPLEVAQETGGATRNIPLEGYDAIIPPAAKEELMALADQASRRVSQQELGAAEYKQIARLMSSVGRYDEARVALSKADALQAPVANESDEQVSIIAQGLEQETPAEE